jgi:hypothetical protein
MVGSHGKTHLKWKSYITFKTKDIDSPGGYYISEMETVHRDERLAHAYIKKFKNSKVYSDSVVKTEAKPFMDTRKKNPKSRKKKPARKKNPPARLIQPFKVVIGATAKRGHKTMMWFDGKHFRTTKVKRAMFSSVHNAKVMALSLIKRFPVLSKYQVGIYRAV